MNNIKKIEEHLKKKESDRVAKDIALALEVHEEIFNDIGRYICEKYPDIDPTTNAYNLFINLLYVLKEAGWTEEELTKDIKAHFIS